MEEVKYCPKCGEKLVSVRLNNEEPRYEFSVFTLRSREVIGNKYSRKTGKRLYREEWYCPNKDKVKYGLFGRKEKEVSHYEIYGEYDLEEEQLSVKE